MVFKIIVYGFWLKGNLFWKLTLSENTRLNKQQNLTYLFSLTHYAVKFCIYTLYISVILLGRHMEYYTSICTWFAQFNFIVNFNRYGSKASRLHQFLVHLQEWNPSPALSMSFCQRDTSSWQIHLHKSRTLTGRTRRVLACVVKNYWFLSLYKLVPVQLITNQDWQ